MPGIVDIAARGVVSPSRRPRIRRHAREQISTSLKARIVMWKPSPRGLHRARRSNSFTAIRRLQAPRDLVRCCRADHAGEHGGSHEARELGEPRFAPTCARVCSGPPGFGVGADVAASIAIPRPLTMPREDPAVADFHNATSCSSKTASFVEPIAEPMLAALGRIASSAEGRIARGWRNACGPTAALSGVIGHIARDRGGACSPVRSQSARVLLVDETGSGRPGFRQKLSPCSHHRARDFAEPRIGGHLSSRARAIRCRSTLAREQRSIWRPLPVARVIVNQVPRGHGGSFAMPAGFALHGCGTWLRNRFSENMNVRHDMTGRASPAIPDACRPMPAARRNFREWGNLPLFAALIDLQAALAPMRLLPRPETGRTLTFVP